MNNLYENNMKTLKKAVDYCNETYSHDEIIKILEGDDDILKQLCLIELNKINSRQEADILVNNLTGKSGPIRETASAKILDLISNQLYNNFFQSINIYDSFIKGITDINPSVSRNIIEVIKYSQNKDYLIKNIIQNMKNVLDNSNINAHNRSYELNKLNFNLYWNLEALYSLSNNIEVNETITEILLETAKSTDYTLREKTAKLAHKLHIENIEAILKADDNIYVSKYFQTQ